MISESQINKIVERWQKKGFTCEIWKSSAGQSWLDPGHETDEVFVLLEGEMEISLGGKKYRPQIGEEFLVPAQEAHRTVNTGKTTNRFYWIHGYEWPPTQKH